jgi:hypothetical protein
MIPFDSRPSLRERRRSGQALLEILRGIAETIRETLPSDAREGAVFLSAMCWSFVLFWAAVLIASWLSCRAAGNC